LINGSKNTTKKDHIGAIEIWANAQLIALMNIWKMFRQKVNHTWQWDNASFNTDYKVIEPSSYDNPPVLIIALSSKIDHNRVTALMGDKISIWELTIDNPNNDYLKCSDQLSKFRETVRKLNVLIADKHGINTPLAIFPSMPVSTAIEFGRVRMPKADMPLIIYDQNNKRGGFVKALQIERTTI